MRFSEPSIEAALRSLAAEGVGRAVGIVLSPQWSPLIMGGYDRAVAAARESIGPDAPEVVMAREWHDQFDAWAASYVSPYDDLIHATAVRNSTRMTAQAAAHQRATPRA